MAKVGNKAAKWVTRLILGGFLVTGVHATWVGSGRLIPYIVPGTGTQTVDECVVDEVVRAPVYGSGAVTNPGATLDGCGPIASSDGSASGMVITELTLHTIYNPASITPDICFAASATSATGSTARCLSENVPDQKYGGTATGGVFRLTFTGSNLQNFWKENDVIRVVDGTNNRGFVGQLDVHVDDVIGD